ncbi:O-antigen ligase family protein [Undibacterium sp. RuRC25W]|uniref:O-antigen ligase family protein n=1 Tax=Undibacterium sp. RuRC25W TaxID=3413047 RepID=UPI003BF0F4EF
MKNTHPSSDIWLFRALLALIVYLPLPLASNRTWAIAILVTLVAILFGATLIVWRKQLNAMLEHLDQFRAPLIIFFLFLMVSVLQVTPLPDAVIQLLSPEAYNVQVIAGLQGHMHLSLDVYQSRLMLGLTTSYLSVFMLCLLLVRDAERLSLLMSVLVWSGLFQAIVGVFLFSIGAHYRLFFVDIIHENVIGTFVNRNHFAGYMEMTLAVGIGLMIAKLGRGGPGHSGWKSRVVAALTFVMSPKMRLRLMLVVMVIALVLTRSRMGNSAFFSAMLIVGVITIVLSRRTAPATATLILSLVIVDVFVIGTWVGLDKVVSRLNRTEIVAASGAPVKGIAANGSASGSASAAAQIIPEAPQEESVEQRSLPAKYSLAMIKQFPAFGTGAGSFYNSFNRYRPPEITDYFDHAHNDYVELMCDLGIGAWFLFLLTGMTLWQSLRAMRVRQLSIARGAAFGTAMSIVALAIHSSVDFNLQIPANALTFVIILSLAWIAMKLPSSRHQE